jgi:hypothetical protein
MALQMQKLSSTQESAARTQQMAMSTVSDQLQKVTLRVDALAQQVG